MAEKHKFLVVSTDVLPEVFLKVVEAKELVDSGEVSCVSEAVKRVDIGRSTYYKYCEKVQVLKSAAFGKKITISLVLTHESGVLSGFLRLLAENNCNILTISQDSPVSGKAMAAVTFDVSNIKTSFNELIDALKKADGVKRLEITSID
jgi:chorismate mutase